ncbi:MAG TPA: PAS domain S-box protein, partial [Actinomycetota bacterium]|nr:PAS domain S-box protein [Actinomycetota bacterium]
AYQTQATGEALVVAAASYIRSVPGDDSSEPLAILVAGYSFEAMQQFVSNFSKAQGASISVADHRGVLVVSPTRSRLELRSQIFDKRIRDGLKGKSGVVRIQTDSGPSLSAYHPVPRIGWVVVTEVPERIAFAPIATLSRALAGALLLTTAIIAMGLALLHRTLRERDRAEIRLLNNEQSLRRFGAIVDSSEDAIVSKTLDGIIASWNPGAEKLYGYKAEEVIGRSISILVPDDRPNEISDILGSISKGEVIQHFDTVRVRKDGTLVDVSLTVSPVRDENGDPVGASAIGRDVSIRKKAEGALKESEARFAAAYAKERAAVERLENLDKLKNEFVGMISHDLRSPLAVISGYSKLILQRWEQLDDEKKITFLKAIERSVQQQEELVDDVLQVARLESADLVFQSSPFGYLPHRESGLRGHGHRNWQTDRGNYPRRRSSGDGRPASDPTRHTEPDQQCDQILDGGSKCRRVSAHARGPRGGEGH